MDDTTSITDEQLDRYMYCVTLNHYWLDLYAASQLLDQDSIELLNIHLEMDSIEEC